MGFCTVADIESLLQVTIHTDATKNAAAVRAIAEATEAIKNYTHQALEMVEDDEITLDCAGGNRIFLPELPVTSVSEVIEDGDTLTVDDDYKLGQHGILYRVDDDWATGVQIVTITYTHGYDSIPDDIVAVCTRAASRIFQAGLTAAELAALLGVTGMTLGDYSVQFGGAGGSSSEGTMGASGARMLLMSEKDMLNRYRYVAQ